MAIDFSKIKARIAAEASKGKKNFEVVRRLKLKPGENRLRIMPPWTEEGDSAGQFWSETYTHWSIGEGGYQEEGGKRFTCPVKTPGGPGGTCEVCDLNSSLRGSGDPADAELGKQIYARRQFSSNVVNLKDTTIKQVDVDEWHASRGENAPEEECPLNLGDTKVQVWSYPQTVYKDLLDVCSDGLDITDIENGHDVIITKEGVGLATQYRVRINPKASPFAFAGDLTKNLYDMDKMIRYAEPGDMQKALNGELVKKAPQLAPKASKPVPSLPPKKASPKAVVTAPEPEPEADTDEDPEPPPCFKDPKVHSSTDVQCVGGSDEDGNEYDACPHYDPCKDAVEKLVAPPKRRAAVPATTGKKAGSAVEEMEARLKAALEK